MITASKLLRIHEPMGTKVEEEDPTDLLPNVAAEKMTRRLLHIFSKNTVWKTRN